MDAHKNCRPRHWKVCFRPYGPHRPPSSPPPPHRATGAVELGSERNGAQDETEAAVAVAMFNGQQIFPGSARPLHCKPGGLSHGSQDLSRFPELSSGGRWFVLCISLFLCVVSVFGLIGRPWFGVMSS